MGHHLMGNYRMRHYNLGHYNMGHQGNYKWSNMNQPMGFYRSSMGYPQNYPGYNGDQHMQIRRARQPLKRNQNVCAQLNALSTTDLEKIEKEVGFLKLSDFTLLREKYDTRSLTLKSLNHQLSAYKEIYKTELGKEKEKQDTEVLQRYRELETEVKMLTKQLDELELKIKKMIDMPSPFAIANVKLPKLGSEDTYSHRKLECVPYSDEKTSVREVWNFLVEIGEDLNLSENTYSESTSATLNIEKRIFLYFLAPLVDRLEYSSDTN